MIVVEDDKLLLSLLAERLDAEPDIEVTGTFRSCSEYRRRFDGLNCDVVISDVRLLDGTGLEIGVYTKRRRPEVAVVLISSYEVPGLLMQIPDDVRSGWAFVAKQSAPGIGDLLDAAAIARRGGLLLPSSSTAGTELLTDRERTVLRLLGAGDSNRAIAAQLDLSVKTVETMLSSIYQKLGLGGDEPAHNQRVLAARIALSLAY